MSISLFFSIYFLQKDIRDIKYDDSVSPKLSYWVIGVFHNITELDPSFSHKVFEGCYMSNGHQLSKGGVKNQITSHI
jgi:hypothetical protein